MKVYHAIGTENFTLHIMWDCLTLQPQASYAMTTTGGLSYFCQRRREPWLLDQFTCAEGTLAANFRLRPRNQSPHESCRTTVTNLRMLQPRVRARGIDTGQLADLLFPSIRIWTDTRRDKREKDVPIISEHVLTLGVTLLASTPAARAFLSLCKT